MSEHYSSTEALEHVERTHELLHRSEVTLLRFVPLLAAVLAIFAGLSSLYGGRLAEQMLSLKNEALLSQVKAADLWTEYEAESIKAHQYGIAAGSSSGKASAGLRTTAAKYRREQVPLRERALEYEQERDRALNESDVIERRKVQFDIALALFEVSIVLASIAAMLQRPIMFVVAGVGGALGMVVSIIGILGGRT